MSTPASSKSGESTHVPIWRDVLLAFRGQERDYTSLPLERAVVLLAVPMVLEMVMESLFAVVDVFWVARLGTDAIAVVGLTESIMTLIYAVAIGMSFAGTALVARRIGEGEPRRAAETAAQVILLGTVCAGLIGAVGAWLAPQLLRAMGADAAVVAEGTGYTRIMLGGNATVFLIFLINAVFRGAGDAALAMRTLVIANCLNIALDPCFVFGWGPFPELGLTGAAVATNIGRGVGVIYQLWHLTGRHSRIRVHAADFAPDLPLLGAIVATAKNGVAQLVISTTSWVGLFKILAMFGSSVVAGYTIALRVIIFALMPAWGLANAGSTLVGQNLGAGKPERAAAAVRIAARYNMIFLGAVGLLFVLLCRPIVGVFTSDPAVAEHAIRALWIISLAFPLYALGMCMEGAFNGAGDTWTPTRLNFYCFWLGQVPLAWVLSRSLQWGPVGIYVAVTLSFSALAVWGAVLFRKGNWKKQIV